MAVMYFPALQPDVSNLCNFVSQELWLIFSYLEAGTGWLIQPADWLRDDQDYQAMATVVIETVGREVTSQGYTELCKRSK